MSAKAKATVTTIYLLDGEPRNAKGDLMEPRTTTRNVFTRKNGSHYIVTLGYREDVFLQEDGTFVEYMTGHTIGGGIAV